MQTAEESQKRNNDVHQDKPSVAAWTVYSYDSRFFADLKLLGLSRR